MQYVGSNGPLITMFCLLWWKNFIVESQSNEESITQITIPKLDARRVASAEPVRFTDLSTRNIACLVIKIYVPRFIGFVVNIGVLNSKCRPCYGRTCVTRALQVQPVMKQSSSLNFITVFTIKTLYFDSNLYLLLTDNGLCNLEVQCRIHKGSPVVPILSRMNPIPRIDATLLETYPSFFYENLVDFELRLNEATLNLHTHAWIFFRLSKAWVDGKKHFSECSLRIFIVRKMTGCGSYPYTQDSQDMLDSINSDPDFTHWVHGYDASAKHYLTQMLLPMLF